MDTISGIVSNLDGTILGNTRVGLIRSLVQKYHPGLSFCTDEPTEDDDYYGEWDEEAGMLVFTDACDDLTDEEMMFVVLHEIAHALTHDGCHQHRFYGVLTALVISEGVSWPTAIRVEQVIPRLWETYLN